MKLYNNPPLNIVLYEPQIPPNTGNIARLCAATKCHLILLGKLGFDLTDKKLKRAGLDYWQFVSWEHKPKADEFFEALNSKRFHFYQYTITNLTLKLIQKKEIMFFLEKKLLACRKNGWNAFLKVVLQFQCGRKVLGV